MERCLGVYLGDKLVRYAKLSIDKNKNISVEAYGTKYVIGEKKGIIDEILNETNSQNTPISINLIDEKYTRVEDVLPNLSKNDLDSVVALQIEDIANASGVNDKLLLYNYEVVPSTRDKENNQIDILYCDRSTIEQYSKVEDYEVKGAYPVSQIITNLVAKEEKNYVVINLDEKITITSVFDTNISNIQVLDVGMHDIVERLSEQLGSYAKAYDTCKTINVYTEDQNLNNPEIEKIIEPVLQDILRKIESEIKPIRSKIPKIFLTGMGVLFTNIDILFEQYYGITTEILKPYFAKSGVGIRNIAELVETNTALALANELLQNELSKQNFMIKVNKKQNKLFGKADKKDKKLGVKTPKGISFSLKDPALVFSNLLMANLVVGVILIGYIIFGVIYAAQIDKMKLEVASASRKVESKTGEVNEDIKYIKENADDYKTVNDLVNKLLSNEIAVNGTYNVANFMQNIMKFIPNNVQLINISSDDNKNITISAESDSYAALGYFISQMKLEAILTNVKVTKVTHGDKIQISIGGVLP